MIKNLRKRKRNGGNKRVGGWGKKTEQKNGLNICTPEREGDEG